MTEAPTSTPQPPDLTRRTLTPLGYAVCVVVPLLIAALGLVYLHFHYDKEQLVRGTKLSILTSDWQPGDGGDTAQVTGRLSLDGECLRLDAQDGTTVDVVWPRDYEAAVEQSGQGPRISVYDPDRDIVARSSDLALELGGGFAPVGGYAGLPCAPSSGQVFLVQSDVKRVDGS